MTRSFLRTAEFRAEPRICDLSVEIGGICNMHNWLRGMDTPGYLKLAILKLAI